MSTCITQACDVERKSSPPALRAARPSQRRPSHPSRQKRVVLSTVTKEAPPPPLLPRIAQGDPLAVQECIDRYKSLIWWLARKQADEDAEDAVQDIFVELWKNADRFDPKKASESTFVGMIARRRLIDLHRKKTRRPSTEPIDDHYGYEGEGAHVIEASADASLAQRAIGELNEKERNVLRLAVHQGMSHSEIAGELDMPLGTVKTYVRRGLMRVRDKLKDPAEPRSSASPRGQSQ